MRDYTLALQERYSYQWRKSNNTCVLNVNDIVLVKGDSAPRLSWWKGKVEKLIDGDDNLVSREDVCVYQDNLGKTIVIRRPLQWLVLLEVTNIIHNDSNKYNQKLPHNYVMTKWMANNYFLSWNYIFRFHLLEVIFKVKSTCKTIIKLLLKIQ